MIAAVMMGAFVYHFMNFNVIIVVLLAAVIYRIMLLALKTFSNLTLLHYKQSLSQLPTPTPFHLR